MDEPMTRREVESVLRQARENEPKTVNSCEQRELSPLETLGRDLNCKLQRYKELTEVICDIESQLGSLKAELNANRIGQLEVRNKMTEQSACPVAVTS